jgi:hypothetical protein
MTEITDNSITKEGRIRRILLLICVFLLHYIGGINNDGKKTIQPHQKFDFALLGNK